MAGERKFLFDRLREVALETEEKKKKEVAEPEYVLGLAPSTPSLVEQRQMEEEKEKKEAAATTPVAKD